VVVALVVVRNSLSHGVFHGIGGGVGELAQSDLLALGVLDAHLGQCDGE
jgi:hypothetical protein